MLHTGWLLYQKQHNLCTLSCALSSTSPHATTCYLRLHAAPSHCPPRSASTCSKQQQHSYYCIVVGLLCSLHSLLSSHHQKSPVAVKTQDSRSTGRMQRRPGVQANKLGSTEAQQQLRRRQVQNMRLQANKLGSREPQQLRRQQEQEQAAAAVSAAHQVQHAAPFNVVVLCCLLVVHLLPRKNQPAAVQQRRRSGQARCSNTLHHQGASSEDHCTCWSTMLMLCCSQGASATDEH